MAPVIRGTRILHDGWSRFLVAEVTMPDGTRLTREIEDHGRAVGVLPYDPERRVALLVEQFRPPTFFAAGTLSLLEIPAGLLDESEPEDGRAPRGLRGDRRPPRHPSNRLTTGWSNARDFYRTDGPVSRCL